MQSSIVQDLSPQFDMNSNIEEISSNTGVLPKHEIVCVHTCISYKHVHLWLNLISDSWRIWYRVVPKVCNRNLKQNVFLHFTHTSTVYIVHFIFANKVYQVVRSTSFSRSKNKNDVRRFSFKWSINRYLSNKQVINTHWNLFDFQIFHKNDVPLRCTLEV
jgi:hypothetical protein